MRNFENFGPFKIPREGTLVSENLKQFWQNIEARHSGLSRAKGCYVFDLKPSGTQRTTPWYVGQTNGQTFSRECFKDHTLYSCVAKVYKRSTISIFCRVYQEKRWRFDTESREDD
jgi:hypothetical protein